MLLRRGRVLGLLMVAIGMSAGEPGQPRLSTPVDVVDAVCASLARYHSISCRMVSANWSPDPPPVGVRSRPPDSTCVRVRRSSRGIKAYTETRYGEGRWQGGTVLAACLNGFTKTCRYGTGGDPRGTVSCNGSDPGDIHDPLLMLTQAGPSIGNQAVTLSVTAEGMYRLGKTLKLKDRTRTITWTIDPSHEYLPVKFTLIDVPTSGNPPLKFGNTDYVWRSNVRSHGDLVMTATGLWFPTKVTVATTVERPGQHGKKEVLGWSETTIEDLVLNADMPDELFQFRFPDGTRVEDEVAKNRYVVGPDQ